MTGDQCAQIVNLLVSSFPTGPKGHAWTDSLTELHPGPAMGAARELRDTSERTPTIAQYHAIYRRHLAEARRTREAERGVPPTCQLCDGTGWTDITDERRHAAHCISSDTCHCHAAQPCRCSTGQRATVTHQAILDANAKDRP